MTARQEQWSYIRQIYAAERGLDDDEEPRARAGDVSKLVFRLIRSHEKERDKWRRERDELHMEVEDLRMLLAQLSTGQGSACVLPPSSGNGNHLSAFGRSPRAPYSPHGPSPRSSPGSSKHVSPRDRSPRDLSPLLGKHSGRRGSHDTGRGSGHLSDRASGSASVGRGDNAYAVVRLNIGGTPFWTSEETLTSHSSYFRTMFSGKFSCELQDDGSIFVDRDPALFAPLLSFMRSGELYCPAGIAPTRLQEEADYYGITLSQQQNAQLFCMGLGVDPAQSHLTLGSRLVKLRFAQQFGEHGGALLEMISSKFVEATESKTEARVRIMEGESKYFSLLNSRAACETLKEFFESTSDCSVEIRPTTNVALGLKWFDISLRMAPTTSYPVENLHKLPL